MEKIGIFCAGALGLWFGFKLQDRYDVVCVSKKRIADAIKSKGLTLLVDKKRTTKNINITENPEAISDCKIIMLASKSFDSKENLKTIKKYNPKANIVTIQNGIYTEEVAKELFDKNQIFPASVMIGSKFIDNSTIEEFLNEGMILGNLNNSSKAEDITEIFKSVGIKIKISDNIERDKWKKFMFYCSSATLNSLTATLSLYEKDESWIVKRALNEIASVGRNLKLSFDIEKLKEDVFKYAMNFRPRQWNASVGEDLKRGKKTEIDYLNGYVVELANRFDIDVPVNETLYRLVKILQKTERLKI
ncbi:ketopantoate reductase family protein [Hippea maritima]|uniref:2-dehydropantoate 2-reductase n=1 Tax=Hippea maritima (strain ATCC 700847 / DSM 10411 / MH2) TaxID=760142 RepID=F2LV82_HIPMA|nr:ketopantoate reductase family protein [Hippea maritima]AEA33666.1 2-dehydropantoate 2-reductase [Hippea maritima DSM 10411]